VDILDGMGVSKLSAKAFKQNEELHLENYVTMQWCKTIIFSQPQSIKKDYSCKPRLLRSLRLKQEDLGTPGFLQTRFPVPSPPQARASVWALGQRSALHHSYERLSDSSAAAQCTISL